MWSQPFYRCDKRKRRSAPQRSARWLCRWSRREVMPVRKQWAATASWEGVWWRKSVVEFLPFPCQSSTLSSLRNPSVCTEKSTPLAPATITKYLQTNSRDQLRLFTQTGGSRNDLFVSSFSISSIRSPRTTNIIKPPRLGIKQARKICGAEWFKTFPVAIFHRNHGKFSKFNLFQLDRAHKNTCDLARYRSYSTMIVLTIY